VPNQEEIGRIADAVAAIRPEWPVSKIADYLEAHHAKRPYPVLAAAAVCVAADTMSTDLSWLQEDGYWWITIPSLAVLDRQEHQRVTRVRDEDWWTRYNLAAAKRQAQFGYPKDEVEA
jgi:hypothetical protein